jgi:hypothetical protein
VLVDRVAAEFMGVWGSAALARELGGHKTSPLIDIAAKRFKLDIKAPATQGDGADLLKSPRPVHYKAMAPFRLDWDPGQSPLAGGPAKGLVPAVTTDTKKAPEGGSTNTPATPNTNGNGNGPAKPEAHAAPLLAGEGIELDGKPGDAAWSKAKPVLWDTDYAGAATGVPTKARFLWSKDGLYVLFEIANTGLNTDQSRPVSAERKGLYNEDCVELFLTPDPAAPKRYFEVEIGPFGHFFDLLIDKEAGSNDIAWSSGARIATTRSAGARTAVIEAVLTAPGILSVLKPGARLPMNLYRMEGKEDRRYLAWSPPKTKKPNFHVPEAFGSLVLDP